MDELQRQNHMPRKCGPGAGGLWALELVALTGS